MDISGFLLQEEEEAEMLIFEEFTNKISHSTFTGIKTVNHKYIFIDDVKNLSMFIGLYKLIYLGH